MSWIINKPIAHRGLHDKNTPENSMASFEKAIKFGYAIELDIHLSIDSELIVFHDDNLKRMTGFDGSIESQPLSAIKALKLLETSETIPTLHEVLSLVGGRTPILIEIKNKYIVGRLERKLSSVLAEYNGNFAIQSFNPYSVGWFEKNNPKVLRGQLSGDFKDEDLAYYKKIVLRYFLMNWKSKPDFIAYDIDLLPCMITSRLQKKNLPLLAWIIDSKEKKIKASKYADNIIFEGINL